jgi:hypothetical protein
VFVVHSLTWDSTFTLRELGLPLKSRMRGLLVPALHTISNLAKIVQVPQTKGRAVIQIRRQQALALLAGNVDGCKIESFIHVIPSMTLNVV